MSNTPVQEQRDAGVLNWQLLLFVLQVSLLDCLMSVMSMEGDKIQNVTVILVCMILGSYGSDNEKYHLVG